ncbi:Pre-mRNA-splicing factor cef1 [Neophaeococcomyces mojaviensis]|uniref:Pre-mRNA-splicing factor cef1 n=1 Tax=Neophaeococcomyces mojaviensis TaxID=3383035 RepID=A0ACC2ZQP5_9EURO|nr:Pre-mRNA-splicing factor cef1 [Knufia sp. JES_112]
MPVVKGGVWTNIEDEILKASVSKYGLNQWARVSSLLARKTPKQCKARWTEWLDPAIRKIEWSKEEDEKLLHLAKLMPTQWRTIAPIVGRTANQCLERYSRLLDEAEARENDELALGGPDGGETAAPTGDDVRKLRPGELDPDPESKPARPDTIDMDEDEKEMLSEARARLANTQGKKAKRKARERQLEESRRLAVLQKRRELKNAGINTKITHKKKGQMDYNADIPFEKAPAAGFYDTLDEEELNEKEREGFDPRKQQLARKRQGDPEENQDNKRQKQDKGSNDAMKAAARAGALQKMREAEQQSKRRALNLPAPQVSEAELEDIVKMGMAGDRASRASGEEGDKGLVSQYTNMVGSTPIRTPMAPPQEDRIANEIRNIRALNETQSSLLGGENTPLHQGSGSTGFEGAAPTRHVLSTPNPLATPFRQVQGTGPGATPLRTPRDTYTLNTQNQNTKAALRAKLASLPRPKATEFELELPEEQQEPSNAEASEREDQEEIDRRTRQAEEAAAALEFARQTQVIQRSLPRPRQVDAKSLLSAASSIEDPIRSMIAQEAALLISHDAATKPLPGSKPVKPPQQLDSYPDSYLALAREQIAAEVDADPTTKQAYDAYFSSLSSLPNPTGLPSALASTTDSSVLHAHYESATATLLALAEDNNKREKKLNVVLGGYMARQKGMKKKLDDTHKSLLEESEKLRAFEDLRIAEEAGLARRLEGLRDEVSGVVRREREVMEEYRAVRDEVAEVKATRVNGVNGHA